VNKKIEKMETLTTESHIENSENSQQWLSRVGREYETQLSALETELAQPGISTVKFITVSGFKIPTVDTSHVEMMKRAIVLEAENSRALRSMLEKVNIKPIAILPKELFERIVDEAKLYTFKKITPEGEVYGNGKNYNDNKTTTLEILLLFISFIGSLFTGKILQSVGLQFNAWAFLAIQIGILVGGIIYESNTKKESGEKIARFALLITFPLTACLVFITIKFSQERCKKLLWPDRTDVGKEKKDLFKIILPTAPEHVQQKLLICHTNNIKTFLVVDEKAFEVVFGEKIIYALRKKYHDPIICYQRNDMVAVIDQFGEFAGEKKVIQYLKDHFTAIKSNLITVQQN
jgi:hypothetical protein